MAALTRKQSQKGPSLSRPNASGHIFFRSVMSIRRIQKISVNLWTIAAATLLG